MLKRNIKHVFMASLDHWQEKKKGNIQESLTCSTRTGTLPQKTGLSKSFSLSFLRLQECVHRAQGGENQLLLCHLSSQS